VDFGCEVVLILVGLRVVRLVDVGSSVENCSNDSGVRGSGSDMPRKVDSYSGLACSTL
jgi:hypothetical protein